MSDKDLIRMRHMLDSAKAILGFLEGKKRSDLDGNRLIHAYFDIDRDVVWRTATENLPSFCTQLEQAIFSLQR